jgi:asparagine synthase (glutamine-hydrolysing)
MLHTDPRQRYGALMGDSWLLSKSTLGRQAQRCAWPDPEAELVRAAMASDRAAYLPGDLLVKADRATMASSLEIRAPFLDHRLWDHVAGAPTAWIRAPGGPGKLPIRRQVEREMGTSYIDRPKRGFTVPLGVWFSGPLAGMVQDRLAAPDSLSTSLFPSGFGASLLRTHQRGSRDFSARLWRVLQLELWADRTGASL